MKSAPSHLGSGLINHQKEKRSYHWHREDTMKELFYLFHEQLVRIKRYFPRSHGVQRVEDRRIVIGLSMSSSTACNGKMPHVSMGHTKLPTIALSSGAD